MRGDTEKGGGLRWDGRKKGRREPALGCPSSAAGAHRHDTGENMAHGGSNLTPIPQRGGGNSWFKPRRTVEGSADAQTCRSLRDVVVGEDADGTGDAGAEKALAVAAEDAEQEPVCGG